MFKRVVPQWTKSFHFLFKIFFLAPRRGSIAFRYLSMFVYLRDKSPVTGDTLLFQVIKTYQKDFFMACSQLNPFLSIVRIWWLNLSYTCLKGLKHLKNESLNNFQAKWSSITLLLSARPMFAPELISFCSLLPQSAHTGTLLV